MGKGFKIQRHTNNTTESGCRHVDGNKLLGLSDESQNDETINTLYMSSASKKSMSANRNEYPYLYHWGKMMGSFDYYINDQIEKAKKLNAPKNTIYFTKDVPVTFDEVKNPETIDYFKVRGL